MQMTLDLTGNKKETKKSRLMQRAINCLKANPDGLTADEIANLIGHDWWSVRPRMTDLRKKGHLINTGNKRRNVSGTPATVWRAR